jgi:branched-chain amino acid transport system substrate-binding protein
MRRSIMPVRSTALALLATLLAVSTAHGQGAIKIGDINSYKAMAANMAPYRKGVDLAAEQVNAAGGVLGKKFEIVSRDDGANPGDAVRMVDDLLLKERVDLLSGTILSHIGLAITDYAKQHKVFFLASASLTDRIVWESGNRYTFRLRPSTYTHAAVLVPYAAKLKRKRWTFVYPNYEYGQSAVASFKELLKRSNPMSSLSPISRPRSGRLTPARLSRRSRMQNPTPSLTSCSAPISPSSCARARRAACFAESRW